MMNAIATMMPIVIKHFNPLRSSEMSLGDKAIIKIDLACWMSKYIFCGWHCAFFFSGSWPWRTICSNRVHRCRSSIVDMVECQQCEKQTTRILNTKFLNLLQLYNTFVFNKIECKNENMVWWLCHQIWAERKACVAHYLCHGLYQCCQTLKQEPREMAV